ncbi:MAG TPA: thioredoxin [Candidatus Nanoarchaeia archaeon]|nr:thioredoxin [Candidatus Woesearchaeota archaeon]HIH12570.1 thioredoxin [Candidatus Woesearchaeota archaeon]HLC70711.1 thioredoxin [Candidatus Nanoarchaeia archaeon]
MVLELDAAKFESEVLQSKTPVIVDFWAEWCGPCKMMAPVFEELSKEYTGKLKFAKISVEDYPDIGGQNQITGIPCLIVFHKGEEVDRIVGFLQKAELKRQIDGILKQI